MILSPVCLRSQEPKPLIIPASYFTPKVSQASVWDMEIDSNGHVYMVGNSNAKVFDGATITKVKPETPETDGSAFPAIFKDAHQRLWGKGLYGGFKELTKNRTRSHTHSDSFRHLTTVPIMESAWGDRMGRWHLAPRGIGYYVVEPHGEVKTVLGREHGTYHGFFVTHLDDGTPFHFSITRKDSIKARARLSIYYLDSAGKVHVIAKTHAWTPRYESTLLAHEDNTYTLSMGTRDLFQFSKDSLLRHVVVEHEVIKLFEDSRKEVWIGTVGGLYRSESKLLETMECIRSEDVIAVVAEDQQGGLWLKSEQLRFGYIPNRATPYFSEQNGFDDFENIVSVTRDSSKVYCLLPEYIKVLGPNGQTRLDLPMLKDEAGQVLDHYEPFQVRFDFLSNRLWLVYSDGVASYRNGKWETAMLRPVGARGSYIYDVVPLTRDTFVVVTGHQLYTIVDGRMHADSEFLLPGVSNIQCVAADDSKTIWLGTGNGIFTFKNGETSVPNQIPADWSKYSCMHLAYASGKMCAQVEDKGLFIVGDTSVTLVLDSAGENVHLYGPVIDPGGNLWAQESRSRRGIYRVELKGDTPAVKLFPRVVEPEYTMYRTGLAVTDDHLYMGTDEGLLRERLSELKRPELSTEPLIIDLRVNHQLQIPQKKYELEPEQNSLLVSFGLVDFQRVDRRFRSRLLGLDSTWVESEYTSVQYTNLDPGAYTFQLQARIGIGDWGNTTERQFLIATPYHQKWWFKLLIVMLLIALGSMSYALWSGTREKQRILELNQLRAEQRAFKAQMNPHFIFNALSSIQELVYNQNRIEALKSIAHFAKLMRHVLDHSAKDTISLDEEITVLSNYLKLESLRFGGKISFSVDVAENVDTEELFIPPMIIQPFVENTIKHGVQNKHTKSGTVSIQFSMKNDCLECVIEDDGVGRTESLRIKEEQGMLHQSFGMHSIRERLIILNAQRSKNLEMQIIDLKDEQGNPSGTKVILRIPQNDVP